MPWPITVSKSAFSFPFLSFDCEHFNSRSPMNLVFLLVSFLLERSRISQSCWPAGKCAFWWIIRKIFNFIVLLKAFHYALSLVFIPFLVTLFLMFTQFFLLYWLILSFYRLISPLSVSATGFHFLYSLCKTVFLLIRNKRFVKKPDGNN